MSDALDRMRTRSAMRELERDDLTLEGDEEEALTEWYPSITYRPGQIVWYSRGVYRAVRESTGEDPTRSSAWARATDLID